jgi:hypothetical protein
MASDENKAVQDGIITHMNTNHTPSLSRYLEHYCALPSPKNPKLESITLDHLIITSNHGRNLIPLDPPMASYTGTRERLAAMDKAALEGLGRSDIGIKEYKLPRPGWQAGVFTVCAVTMAVFCRRGNLVKGSWIYEGALKYLPDGFLQFLYTVQPLVFWGMLVIHSSEAAWMGKGRLRRHGVRLFSGVWWMWILSTFVEGFGAFVRFDGLVVEAEERLGRRGEGRQMQGAINAARKE